MTKAERKAIVLFVKSLFKTSYDNRNESSCEIDFNWEYKLENFLKDLEKED